MGCLDDEFIQLDTLRDSEEGVALEEKLYNDFGPPVTLELLEKLLCTPEPKEKATENEITPADTADILESAIGGFEWLKLISEVHTGEPTTSDSGDIFEKCRPLPRMQAVSFANAIDSLVENYPSKPSPEYQPSLFSVVVSTSPEQNAPTDLNVFPKSVEVCYAKTELNETDLHTALQTSQENFVKNVDPETLGIDEITRTDENELFQLKAASILEKTNEDLDVISDLQKFHTEPVNEPEDGITEIAPLKIQRTGNVKETSSDMTSLPNPIGVAVLEVLCPETLTSSEHTEAEFTEEGEQAPDEESVAKPKIIKGLLIRKTPEDTKEVEDDLVELPSDGDDDEMLKLRALTKVSSQIVASDQFYSQTLPGAETEMDKSEMDLTSSELEIKPLKSAIIQDIQEIGKKFLHLSVKKVKEEGEVVVEFRRYGIDAPELANVSGDPENFIEHPEQYVEISRLEEVEGEVKKVTRYYKHDDPELLKYLSQTGLTSVEQLSKLSHRTTPVTRLDKTGFLKGSLEYYINDDDKYEASVKFVDVTDLNENIIECRNYRATDTEFLDLSKCASDSMKFKHFPEEYYELNFCFVLPSGNPVYVKHWAPLNEQFLQTLLQTEFPHLEVFEKLGKLSVSRPINKADDLLLTFLPHKLQVNRCDVILEINPVLAVKVTEHHIGENAVIINIDIVMAQEQDQTIEDLKTGRKTVRHVFYSTLPDVTILSEKRLVHKSKDETKFIGRLFEIQKTSTDVLGRQLTKKSRFVNPNENTILMAEELQGMYHFLKVQFEQPSKSYLHTKNVDDCPIIDKHSIDFLQEIFPSSDERFTFEEKFEPGVGTGERTLMKYTKDKRSDCIIESRTYRSAITKILITPSNNDVTDPQFYEFIIIQHSESKILRNRVWIPVDEKLPKFFTHSENIPLKGSRRYYLTFDPSGTEDSAINILFNNFVKVNKIQHVETSNLIDANRFDVLDTEELEPKSKKTKMIVEIRPILEISVNELWDGKTRWLLLDRKVIDFDQIYHLTNYYQVKYPTIRKIRRSRSSIKLFSSSLVGSRRLIIPSGLKLRKSTIDEEYRKQRVASKLYFALYTGEEPTCTLETSKEFLPIETVLNVAESEKSSFNTVEIHSRVVKPAVQHDEELEAQEFEDEELEITETTPVGISVKQIVQEEKPKIVIFEGTSYDVNGIPRMQQRSFRADDEMLVRALEEDPNAMVLPLSQDQEEEPCKVSDTQNVKNLLSMAPINIDVCGNDGTHFFYKWVDGKVLSTKNLNETVNSKDDNIDHMMRESIFEDATLQFDLEPNATDEEIKEPKKHQPKKITRKVLKIIDPGNKEQMSLEEAYRNQLIDGETYMSLKEKNLMKKPKVYDPVSRKPMSFVQMKDIGLELPPVMKHRRGVHGVEMPEEKLDSDEWLVTGSLEPVSPFRTVSIDQVTLAQQTQGVSKFDKKLEESARTIKALAITLPEVSKMEAREVVSEDRVMIAEDKTNFKARVSKKVTVIDPITEERVSLEEGFKRGLFDEVMYEQFKQNEYVETGIPVSKQEYEKLVKLEKPLQISYETKQLVFSQIEESCMEMNILQDLVPEVETQRAVYAEPAVVSADQQELMSPESAFQKGLIDHSTYCNLIEYDTSVQLVTVKTTKTVPVRPLEFLESPIEHVNQLHKFEEAMEELETVAEVYDDFQTTIFNPNTNDLVSPTTALEIGLIDKPTFRKLMIEVTSVLEEPRLLMDSQNFVLKVWVSDPVTGQKLTPKQAFAKGLINISILDILENTPKEIQHLSPKSDLWKILIFECVNESDNITQISFDDAIDMRIIDASFYIRVFENSKQKPLMSSSEIPEQIRAKFEQTKTSKDRDSGLEPEGMIIVTDPETGMNKSLDEALTLGLIDENKYKELKRRENEGIFELEVNTINGNVCIVVNQSGETFTAEEAFARGLITLPDYEKIRKEKDAFKMTRHLALPQAITMKDPSSKKTLTLEEAVQENIISQSAYVEIISRANSKLESCIASGPSGISIHEPLTGDIIPLSGGVKQTLISQAHLKIVEENCKNPLSPTKGENLIFVPGLVSLYDPVSGREIPLGEFEKTNLNYRPQSESFGNLLRDKYNEKQRPFIKSESNLRSSSLGKFPNVEVVFETINLNEIKFPRVFNYEKRSFEFAPCSVTKLAHQVPGACKIVEKETGSCFSIKDAFVTNLITEDERDALIAEQINILISYVDEIATNIEIKNVPKNQEISIENEEIMTNMKNDLMKFLSKVRLIGLFAQNDVIRVYNPQSDKLETTSNFSEDVLLKIPVSVTACGSKQKTQPLETFLEQNKEIKIDRSFEEFMSCACINPGKAGVMLVYLEKLAKFATIEEAVLEKWVNLNTYCKLRQEVLRDSIFMKNGNSGNVWTSLPECLALGMLSDTTYNKLTLILPKTCQLRDIQIYDPLLLTQLDLITGFESGLISFDQAIEIIEVCCQKSGVTSKLFVIDRNNGLLLAPGLALETELISPEDFNSLFLTSTTSYEKVFAPMIEILNPVSGEIFSIGEALRLGFTTFETYDALCDVADSSPMSVPRLLVMLQDSDLASPITAYFDKLIATSVYENLKNENIHYLMPLTPTGITLLCDNEYLTSLDQSFIDDLITPTDFAEILANLSEYPSQTPSFLVLDTANKRLLEIKEAILNKHVSIQLLESLDSNLFTKYKYSDLYCFIPRHGKKLLKDRLNGREVRLRSFLEFLLITDEIEPLLVYDTKIEKFYNQSTALEKELITKLDLSGLETESEQSSFYVFLPNQNKLVSLEESFKTHLLSFQTYQDTKFAFHDRGQYLTKVLIYVDESQSVCTTYEAVLREIIAGEMLLEYSNANSIFLEIVPDPGIQFFDLELTSTLTLNEAVINKRILPENVALLIEHLENEPELFPRTLIIHNSVLDAVSPLEAVENEILTRQQLEALCEEFDGLKLPFKETGLFVWLSVSKIVMSLFEALHERVLPVKAFLALVEKMKKEPELVTKLLVLDETSGDVFTPLMAVDLEVMEMHNFDDILLDSPNLLQPVKSTGIIVLDFDCGKMEKLENCVVNGIISLECYTETLKVFSENGNELRKMMLYFADSDELLSCDKALEKNLIDQSLHRNLLQQHQAFIQPIKTSGLSVLLEPFTSLVSLEDCLAMKQLSYDTYLQTLLKVREHPTVYQKCLVLPKESSVPQVPVTLDEALEKGLISSDVYKKVASSYPEAISLATELEMYILCIESAKVARLHEAGTELGMSPKLVDEIRKECRFAPHQVRKLMIYSDERKQIFTPTEAFKEKLIDNSVYEELLLSQRTALEFVFTSGMSVLHKIDTERLQSLEKCVQANLLSATVFDQVAHRLENDSANVTKVMFLPEGATDLISLQEAWNNNHISKEIFEKHATCHRGLESIRKTETKILKLELDDKELQLLAPELAFNMHQINADTLNEVLKCEKEKTNIVSKLFVITGENRLINGLDGESLKASFDDVILSRLHNLFPREFEVIEKPELKIYDWETGAVFGLPEALKNDVITTTMSDDLIRKIQTEPSRLTKMVLPVKQLMTSFTPSRALSEGLISEQEMNKLHESVNNPTWRLALPNLEVFDICANITHSLSAMIRNDVISTEQAQKFLQPLMEPDFDNLNKLIVWIPEEKVLIDLKEAFDRGIVSDEISHSLCRSDTRFIESYSLSRSIVTVDENGKNLISLESLFHQEFLDWSQYRSLTVKLVKNEPLLGKVVVFQENDRSFSNLKEYLENPDSHKNILEGLRSLANGTKLSSATGLCVFDKASKIIEPLEKAFENKKVEEPQYAKALESFQNEPEKTSGLLICAEKQISWPAEALVKQKLEPSEIRSLQQLHPKAFTPQPVTRILVIQSDSGEILPLEAALNSGMINVEEFVNVSNRSKYEENFATEMILFNFVSLEPEKIPVAVICSAMDELEFQNSFAKTVISEPVKDVDIKTKVEETKNPQVQKLEKLGSPVTRVEPKPSVATKVEKTKLKGFMLPTKSSGQKEVKRSSKEDQKLEVEKSAPGPSSKTNKKRQPTIRRLNDEQDGPSKS